MSQATATYHAAFANDPSHPPQKPAHVHPEFACVNRRAQHHQGGDK